MNLPKFLALSFLAASAFTACTQEKPVATNADAMDPVILAAQLKAAYMDANELMMNGKTNDAVVLLGKTLADVKFADFENRLSQALNDRQPEYPPMPDPDDPNDFDFTPPPYQEPDISYADLERRRFMLDHMVRLSLLTADADEALNRVIPIFKADAKLALDGVNLIYEDIRNRLSPADLFAWITRLSKTPKLPEAAIYKFKEWEIHAALENKLDDRAISVLSGLLAKHADDPATIQLAQRSVNLLIERGRLDSLGKLIDALKRVQSDPVKNLVLAAQTRLAAANADWNAYAGFMKTAIATLNDQPLFSLIVQTLPQAEKAGQSELVNTLCKTIVTTQPKKTSSIRHAIQIWERDARANNPADFPNRVQAMIDAGVNPGDAFDTLSTFFYAVEGTAERGLIQKLRGLGELLYDKIMATVDDPAAAIAPFALIDIAFTLDDFDAVLRILEKGIPNKDEAWHTMAIIKVKAHRAMFNNKNQEAADQFRAFMNYLDEHGKEEDFSDPISGLTMPKEAILARNANRIAELLAGINPDAAAKARAEARDFYVRALELAKYPEIKAIIEKEMQE